MNNKEKLEKAIQKAIDGGWEMPFGSNCFEVNKYMPARPESIAFGTKEEWQVGQHLEGHWSIQELVFNHDFAKAIFGKELVNPRSGLNYMKDYRRLPSTAYQLPTPKWEYHLQQMVIAEDPIKYLGENL